MSLVGSRAEARQVVRHGHTLVNGRQVNIPSFQVGTGDVVSLKASEKMNERFKKVWEETKDQAKAEWLQIDPAQFKATVKRLPQRADVQMPIQEQLIVELYSK
jgi:small subunit ribosomal protein S4